MRWAFWTYLAEGHTRDNAVASEEIKLERDPTRRVRRAFRLAFLELNDSDRMKFAGRERLDSAWRATVASWRIEAGRRDAIRCNNAILSSDNSLTIASGVGAATSVLVVVPLLWNSG